MSRVGRLSLRLDAIYCAVVAASLILFLDPIAHRVPAPPAMIGVVAAGLCGWAFLLFHVARRQRLRPWLIGVLIANLAAAVLIAAYTAVRPWDGAFTVLLAALALEVAAFAASQAAALRREARST